MSYHKLAVTAHQKFRCYAAFQRFAGIDGVFRFNREGVAERGLAVIQITPAGMTAVDPAPQEFGAPVARP